MKLDLLAFAAHPDDVEIACSGTVAKEAAHGRKVGIVDFTRGELGSRGSAELREQEAAKASKILGISVRENLGFPDGFFSYDKSSLLEIIKVIRRYQPEIILAPTLSDRHPDHGRAAKMVADACFYSGLVKIETLDEKESQSPWRPKALYHYIQDIHHEPDVIVDITDFYEQKMNSLMAFSSQFYNPDSKEPQTPISTPEFLNIISGRASQFGRLINAKYAEGFVASRTIGVDSLFNLL